MGRYERIAMLEDIAKTKRVELELIEAELERLRAEDKNDFERFKAEINEQKAEPELSPVPKRTGGGIRL